MEESESGINLRELPNDDQDEAKKKEGKVPRQMLMMKIFKILACPGATIR